MTNFPQFKKLSLYDDYEPSKTSNSTGTIPNNNYHKQIGNTMSAMTTERAIEVLKVKVDFLRCYEESGMLKGHEKEQLQALDKAIEVMGKLTNCKHPYTRGNHEEVVCLVCGDKLK